MWKINNKKIGPPSARAAATSKKGIGCNVIASCVILSWTAVVLLVNVVDLQSSSSAQLLLQQRQQQQQQGGAGEQTSASSSSVSQIVTTAEAQEHQRPMRTRGLLEQLACHQNPYRSELEQPLEVIAGRAQAWLDDFDAHYNRSMAERQMWEKKTRHRFFVFDAMAPCGKSITCVGAPSCEGDESKQTCGLNRLIEKQQQQQQQSVPTTTTTTTTAADDEPPCIIYSVGGNNQWGFEISVGKTAPSCEIHTFDCTGPVERFVKPPESAVANLHFHHVCLGTKHENAPPTCGGFQKCGETWTLKEIQDRLGHRRIDLFKMDVEGFEWPILESWPELTATTLADQVILPMQILVEVHYVTQFNELCHPKKRNEAYCGGPFKDPPDFVNFAAHLMRAGYTVSVRHDNPHCPHCTELTLLRTSCPQTGVYQNLV